MGMGSEYDFQRFVDDEDIVVRTINKLQFSLVFEVTDNDNDNTCSITAYGKQYPSDEDCVCVSSDPTCRCNWNLELCAHSYSSVKCIEDIMGKISKVINCEKCERAHVQYQDYNQCPSCFLQKFLERDQPIIQSCPVCYEDTKESSIHRFNVCQHLMCRYCYNKMSEPKRCPLCRSPD